MAEPITREEVLPPGTYAYLLDATKGLVRVHVGPTVINQTNQERPCRYDTVQKKFVTCNLDQAVMQNVVAPEGFYVVLMNPAGKHPEEGRNDTPTLNIGEKINIPGPCTFALYPGQQADLRRGHHLRSNEYLRVKVYNEEKARANWGQAVIRRATPEAGVPAAGGGEATAMRAPGDLALGKQYNVLGTAVSFYIPPTGVSVVPDPEEPTEFVRSAETLEQLEYSVLVDEDGNKEYPRGPIVVFPKPTQRFLMTEQGNRKFRAIEMNELQGIQLKFIVPTTLTFADASTHDYLAGEEAFITGKDMPIYFPEEGHQLVTYDGKTIHYAVAVPEGEARYLMNRKTGVIKTIMGPQMLLPDPVTEIIVRRALSDRESLDWFPGPSGDGSADSLAYNQWLRNESNQEPTTRQGVVSEGRIATRGAGGFAAMNELAASYSTASTVPAAGGFMTSVGSISAGGFVPANLPSGALAKSRQGHKQKLVGEVAERGSTFNEPRTITFANKYKGVPTIKVQPGYAISLVNVDGSRKVIQGPATVLLDYGQTLDVLSLSTGRPKTSDRLWRTAYLNVKNNVVTDILTVETLDHVVINLKLAFNIDFTEEDITRWFAIENYVKHVCDHVRSILKGKIRRIAIEDFYSTSTDIIRNLILGTAIEGGARPGMGFANGALVSDVEVLEVTIGDHEIANLLRMTQHEVVQKNIELSRQERTVQLTKEVERLKREGQEATQQTVLHTFQLAIARHLGESEVEQAQFQRQAESFQPRQELAEFEQALIDLVDQRQLARQERAARLDLTTDNERQTMRERLLENEAKAFVMRLEAIQPGLIETITTASRNDVLGSMAEMASPRMLLGGESLVEVMRKLFAEFPSLEGVISSMKTIDKPKKQISA